MKIYRAFKKELIEIYKGLTNKKYRQELNSLKNDVFRKSHPREIEKNLASIRQELTPLGMILEAEEEEEEASGSSSSLSEDLFLIRSFLNCF